MEGAEFTENIINGVERPVKAAELFAFTLRVRAGNTDVLTWYRYAPSYVSPAYHLLEGFPFIQEPPSGDLQERVLIRHHDYDQCFQSVQLLQWNSQVKFNVTVYRNLPTTRDSIMTS